MNSKTDNKAPATKTAVFMMGGPRAGKSTSIQSLLEEFDGITVLDCDSIKEEHPEYDPKRPELIHVWSSAVCQQRFIAGMAQGISLIYDGTGVNSERLVRNITQAQEAGYHTMIVYVTCGLETALARNSKTVRQVPEEVIREKYSLISTSFEIVSRYADEIRVRSGE